MYDTSCFYNRELKERFMSEKSKEVMAINYYYSVFKNTAETEFELGKDLCNWTYYEIMDYYRMLNRDSIYSLALLNSRFVQYTQFCLNNNIVEDGQNHFTEIKRNVLNDCVNKIVFDKKVINRDQVLKWIEQLPNPKDKFVVLGLFEFGKYKNYMDFVNAKPEDVDYKNHTLKLNNRTVKISVELEEIIQDCLKTDEYISVSSNMIKVMPLVYDGYIIKKYPNADSMTDDYSKGRSVYRSLNRSFKYLGVEKWMSADALKYSGFIYDLNKKANELNMSSVDVLNSEYCEEIYLQHTIQFTPNNKTFITSQYKDYLV